MVFFTRRTGSAFCQKMKYKDIPFEEIDYAIVRSKGYLRGLFERLISKYFEEEKTSDHHQIDPIGSCKDFQLENK
jgi:hypothetical protein